MSSWRVERHYGFGAAQIPIRAESHASEMFGVMEGVGYLCGEFVAGGPVAAMRRLAGQAPALALGLLLCVAFVVTLTKDRTDESPIEVVLFDSSEFIPEPIPEAIPVPPIVVPPPIEIAQPERPKSVTPKPPPPPKLAEQPRPAPPPPVIERPKPKPRARPKPVIPQIARIEKPRSPVLQPVERAVRERPERIVRPRVAIDASKPAANTAAPRMERVARASVDRSPSPRPIPRLAAAAAPALAEPSNEPTRRSFRVASAKPAPGQRPRTLPGIAPASQHREAAPAPPDRNSLRAVGPRPAARQRTRAPAPTLDRAPVPAAPVAVIAERQRASRPSPRPVARRVVRPTAAMAQSRTGSGSVASVPALASRTGRAAPDVPRGSSGDRPGVAGVPLGDLAACVSDRDEDRLKQAVVAAVTTQEECVSSKGTYRFVETKNLNAFLMWIERAPARSVSDRCEELAYALECLESASQRAAR